VDDRSGRKAFKNFADGIEAEASFEKALPEIERQIKKYLILDGIFGHELEDFAQDVFMRVIKKKENCLFGKGEHAVLGWIKTVCRNLNIDEKRKSERRCRAMSWTDGSMNLMSYSSCTAVQQRNCRRVNRERRSAWNDKVVLKEAIDHCIGNLSGRERKMFHLRHLLELSTTEIAKLFEMKIRTVQNILKNGREAVAACLQNQGYKKNT